VKETECDNISKGVCERGSKGTESVERECEERVRLTSKECVKWTEGEKKSDNVKGKECVGKKE